MEAIIAETLRAKHHGGEQTLRDHRRRRKTTYPCRAVGPGQESVRVRLHDHHHEHRQRRRAARQPALDHHRRRASGPGSEGARRRRQAAGAAARRKLRVHERHQHRDARRHDARHVSDGRRRRPRVRRADRARSRCRFRARCIDRVEPRAERALRRARTRSASPPRSRGRSGGVRRLRSGAIVHQTIATRITSASSDSSSSHSIDATPLRVARGIGAPRCGRSPSAAPSLPPDARRPSPPPTVAPPRRTGARDLHGDGATPMSPDGATTRRRPRGRHSASVASALVATRRARGAVAGAVRRRGKPSIRDDAVAVRAFFEAQFYAVPRNATDGADSGTRHRLLRAAALRVAHAGPGISRRRCMRRRTTSLIVELAELYPELKGKRVRGRVDGRRVVPYWPRADIDAGKASVAGKALVYVDRSGRRVLPADPGLRPRRARRGRHHARRLRRPERPAVPLGCARADRPRRADARRASMQGDPRWGQRHPDEAARSCSTRIRATCSSAKCRRPRRARSRRRSTVRSERSACRLLAERTIAVDPRCDSARRTGVPRDDRAVVRRAAAAPGDGAGHRRRDSRAGARRFLLGLRRRCRAAGGPDAPGRAHVAAVAQRRAAARRRRLRRRLASSAAATESSRRSSPSTMPASP